MNKAIVSGKNIKVFWNRLIIFNLMTKKRALNLIEIRSLSMKKTNKFLYFSLFDYWRQDKIFLIYFSQLSKQIVNYIWIYSRACLWQWYWLTDIFRLELLKLDLKKKTESIKFLFNCIDYYCTFDLMSLLLATFHFWSYGESLNKTRLYQFVSFSCVYGRTAL